MKKNIKYLLIISIISISMGHTDLRSSFSLDEEGNAEFAGNVTIGSAVRPVSASLNGQNLTTFGLVPIGTVLDWYNTPSINLTLPSNFVVCNGQLINDSDSPFNNTNIPNLSYQFISAVQTPQEVGKTGGSSQFTINAATTSEGGEHNHGFQGNIGVTDFISTNSTLSGFNAPAPYQLFNEEGDWVSSNGNGAAYGSSYLGMQHRHDLPNTDMSILHTHTLTANVTTTPPFYTLMKIIRYK